MQMMNYQSGKECSSEKPVWGLGLYWTGKKIDARGSETED